MENSLNYQTQSIRILPVYFLSTLLYLINCWSYGIVRTAVIDTVLFLIGLIIVVLIYRLCRRKMGIVSSLLSLLCITIPISFRNVFGGGYDEIPIPWFYLILLTYVFFSIYTFLSNEKKRVPAVSIILIFLPIGCINPLLLSSDIYIGMKEYLSYMTFLLGAFAALITKDSIKKQEFVWIIDLYIFGALFSALGIITQYLLYHFFSTPLFRIVLYGNSRVYLSFLFYDMSGMTLYMATAALILLLTKRRLRFISISLIIVGMAFSTARAGLIALLTVVLFYILVSKKSNRLYISVMFCIISILGLSILSVTRTNIDGIYNMIFDGNGRIQAMMGTLKEFVNSPLLGKGFDLGNQLESKGGIVAHFALINLLGQTGLFITTLFILVIVHLIKVLKTKSYYELTWAVILSLIGSCLVPGFFDLRFFTVLFILGITCPSTFYYANGSETVYDRINSKNQGITIHSGI